MSEGHEQAMRNQELVARVQRGAPGAFDELYHAYVDRVHRKLFAIVGPDADLDDLIQQTFIQVYRHIAGFRGDASFPTWLHRIAVNVALMHLRSRNRWFRFDRDPSVVPLLTPPDPERPDEALSRAERLRLLHQVLDGLKPKKRVAFVLYELEGHTLEEIAEVTAESINTVASRLRSARDEVRRGLERRMKAAERDPAPARKVG